MVGAARQPLGSGALPRADDAARCQLHTAAAFGTLVIASFYRVGIAVAWRH